jgi:excisionase family DNA binding protein
MMRPQAAVDGASWLSPEDLANELGVPTRTVYGWRTKGHGPRGHRIGRHVRFRRQDVDEWLETRADDARTAGVA